MLDQYWLGHAGDINDLPDDDLNVATILAAVDLSRTSPAAIQQRLRRRHARLFRRTVPSDTRQRLDAQFRVRPRQ
jgi:hypothetical protein